MVQLRQLEEKEAESGDNIREYEKLCQLRGFFVKEVEELNDLKETKLMAAAAEGRFAPAHGPLGVETSDKGQDYSQSNFCQLV